MIFEARETHQIQILTSIFIRWEEIGSVPNVPQPQSPCPSCSVTVITLACRCARLPPPRSQFWASANVFFCVSFFLPLFILAALPTASHLDCVFLNIFLKWNTGLCIYLCSISSYWFQPNIPAGWDLLFPFVFKIQNKIWGKPKRKEKTQP